MVIEFERILYNVDPRFRLEDKQDTDTILYFLNAAVKFFVKSKYDGTNIEKVRDNESFEQSQRRIDDLRKIVIDETILAGLTITALSAANPGVVTVSDLGDLQNSDTVFIKNVSGMTEVNDSTHTVANINITNKTFEISSTSGYTAYTSGGYAYILATRPNTYKAALPDRYWFALLEQVKFDYFYNSSYLNKIRGVIKTTSDKFEAALQDPYSEHILHYEEAKPLRLFVGEDVEFTTDSNYFIREYLLKYIKEPNMLAFSVSAIAAGTHKLIPGVLYIVDAGDDIVHPTGGTTYSASETFVAISSDFTTSGTGTVSTVADCNLAGHTHDEIVKIAISLFLQSVGDPRLQNKGSQN